MSPSFERLECRHLLTAVTPTIVDVSAFAPMEFVELPQASAMTSADINQDGVVDLIIADADLTIMLGDGKGGFAQSAALPLNFAPSPDDHRGTRPAATSLTAGDINNDGVPDVIIGGYENLAVVLSATDEFGNWAGLQNPLPLEGSARKLELADLDRDGNLDLLLLTGNHGFRSHWTTGPGSHVVEFKRQAEIRRGDGIGGFSLLTEFVADELYTKELTGDDLLDLLVREENVLRVFSIDVDGNLIPGDTQPVPSFPNAKEQWLDERWRTQQMITPTATEYSYNIGPQYFINDDPYPDVLFADNHCRCDALTPDYSFGTYVAFGTASGEFETPIIFSVNPFTSSAERHYPDLLPPVFVFDVDMNGRDDIIVPNGRGIHITRQIESQTYADEALTYAFPNSPDINQSLLFDFNSDGYLDVVANENVLWNEDINETSLLFGRSDGGFGDSTTLNVHDGGTLQIFEQESHSFVYVNGWNTKTTIHYETDSDSIKVRTVEMGHPGIPANTNNDGFIDYFAIESERDSTGRFTGVETLVLHESRPHGSERIVISELPKRARAHSFAIHDLDNNGIQEFLFRYSGPERYWVARRIDGNWQLENTEKTLKQLRSEAGIEIVWDNTQPKFELDFSLRNANVTFSESVTVPGRSETSKQSVELRFPTLHTDTVGQFNNANLRIDHDHAERDLDNDGDLDLIITHGEGVTVLLAVGDGDFDKDGRPTNSDFGILREAISAGQSLVELPHFDVSGDSSLNMSDEESWITEVARTKVGDIDLDGDVDFADFLIISQNHGESTNDRSRGDLDGNGKVDEDDLRLLIDDYGFQRT